ncbi:flagellar hook protein FlgE [Frondihabitans cladoniiphilus]|uniref:Flagellar hook protein FlgE n=1 Tax=Frondihabitans cladoniiphilus TaxID=715785 RepID=A0ABP8VX79_9MICO
MLRSLYSGIAGLRAHQSMLDVTGNNIANVNTVGFKSSSAVFQDTLSQMTQGAGGPQEGLGGTNPAQIGLGVQVAGISTNFSQGSAQSTGKATDLMISGEGFFVTRNGNQNVYTRAGSFDFDDQGRLTTPDGKIVQGYPATDGVVNEGGALTDLTLPVGLTNPAQATTKATVAGNLPSDAATGTVLTRDVDAYDTAGNKRTLALNFTKTAAGWDVAGSDGTGATGTTSLAFTNGTQTGASSVSVAGVTADLSGVTGYATLSTVAISDVDGRQAGTLDGYTISKDGTLVGSFSNGQSASLGRIALATFTNPAGLEKVGDSGYTVTANSGQATLGDPGSAGRGALSGGVLEMSNVDLSQEFTNLIVAQRGFQANARIITTSDSVLEELVNLKR